MKAQVIYHSADFDGKFSGAVCWHWLTKAGHDVVLDGWDFGDPKIPAVAGAHVWVVDLPPSCLIDESRIGTWIDHHKSSIESFPDNIPGYRIDGVAACRLAWQWFAHTLSAYDHYQVQSGDIVSFADFKDRKVLEPMALTLAGEYDIWDKRDPRADQFQFGLYTRDDWTPETLAQAFFGNPNNAEIMVHSLCAAGEAIMGWQRIFAAQVCKNRGYEVELDGNTYWCLASVHARNSSWFPNETVPEHCNGIMCLRLEGDGNVKVSLYNREGCEDIDHSVIAVKYGGGGHRGACGFQTTLGQAIAAGLVK